jgi:hypothetical protein
VRSKEVRSSSAGAGSTILSVARQAVRRTMGARRSNQVIALHCAGLGAARVRSGPQQSIEATKMRSARCSTCPADVSVLLFLPSVLQ